MNGFLVVVVRSFSNLPVRLFATREGAEEYVKGCRASEESDRPKRGHGEHGPPGILDRVIGMQILEFVGGELRKEQPSC